MNRLFCNFQPESPTNFVYHQRKGPRPAGSAPHTKEELQSDVDEAMKQNPVAYEVIREKEGRTEMAGATLVAGDESCAGLKMSIHRDNKTNVCQLGAGRVFLSHKLEVAKKGQTTIDFMEKIQQTVRKKAFSMKLYKNAVIQVGKYDIITTDDSAEKIYARLQKTWAMLAKHKMKIHACTVPPIEGATPEQEVRRKALNKLILGTDEPLFNVIDMDKAMKAVNTEKPDLYIDGKMRRRTPKTEQEKRAVVFLNSLTASGRYGPKHYEQFAHPPKKVSYAMVGDSFTKPIESNVSGTKKQPGEYVSNVAAGKDIKLEDLPDKPGDTSKRMADRLERKIIPSLTKVAGYRCAVIQASAEDVLTPLKSHDDLKYAESAIKKNIKRMYRHCLESNPPVMVVAMTLPPLRGQIERLYPGEENREARKLHLRLAERINKFIVKETHRLSQHPKNRYKRVMCVRVHEWFGTRKGYVKKAYRGKIGSFNQKGKVLIGKEIHKMMNMMQDGIDWGAKSLFRRPKRGPNGKILRNNKGEMIFEVPVYNQWDYFMDENDYKPSGGWKEVK